MHKFLFLISCLFIFSSCTKFERLDKTTQPLPAAQAVPITTPTEMKLLNNNCSECVDKCLTVETITWKDAPQINKEILLQQLAEDARGFELSYSESHDEGHKRWAITYRALIRTLNEADKK